MYNLLNNYIYYYNKYKKHIIYNIYNFIKKQLKVINIL